MILGKQGRASAVPITVATPIGVGPIRYMTISVHGADHIGTTTSVHIGVQLRYTERALYVGPTVSQHADILFNVSAAAV